MIQSQEGILQLRTRLQKFFRVPFYSHFWTSVFRLKVFEILPYTSLAYFFAGSGATTPRTGVATLRCCNGNHSDVRFFLP